MANTEAQVWDLTANAHHLMANTNAKTWNDQGLLSHGQDQYLELGCDRSHMGRSILTVLLTMILAISL